MTETSHLPCPYEDCASSDAFSWNTEGVGYCFSCHNSYPMKNMPVTFGWAKEEYPLEDKRQPQSIPVQGVKYTDIRSIDPDVCKLYGIQIQTGPKGEEVRYAFKYPHTTKYRMCNDKSKSWIKDRGVGMNHLFGPEFNAGTGKRIYITEGEFDAASLYQILGKTFPVKSLPSSSIGEKFIKHNMKYLSSFKEVVYAGELDDPGRRAANKLYQAFPEKFYFVPMTEFKDANEFLENGKANSLMWAAKSPQRYSPENFFCSADDFANALRNESPYEYVSTGHTGLDEKIRGMVRGGLTFLKAPRGTGKTEVIRYFETGLLKDPEIKIALLHMEEMKSTTLRAMATYQLGTNVRTKEDADNNGVSLDQVEEAAKSIADADNNRTIIFEMMSHDDPLKLLDYTRLAVSSYGADYVFVDHVQRLAYLSNSGVDGATSTLTTLGSRMAQLAKELNIGVIFISQVNDDGRTKYAASLEEEAIICIKIERNAESEDEVEQNTTNFIVDKNRPFAKLGNAGSVYYDPVTTILREDTFLEDDVMIVFDIEANGLFKDATKIHCMSYTTDGKTFVSTCDYNAMRNILLNQKVLIGHNITRYDVPLLNKLLGIKIKAKLYDTLAMSWVINTDRPKHGLESFGEEFGIPKPVVTDWSDQDIQVYIHRCKEDVKINWKLWTNLIQRFMMVYKCRDTLDKYLNYLSFKMKCAFTAEYFGWKLDHDLAQDCVDKLELQQKEKIDELKTVMPMRTLFRKKTKPKVMYKKDGSLSKQGLEWNALLLEHMHPSDYIGEIEIVKGVEEPNPKSSDQVKSWLFSLGWKPCTYDYKEDRKVPQVRKNGQLTQSVKLLISNNPHVKVLDGLTVIQHRLGIFKGFLECEVDGYVQAGIEGLTNTLRFKHRKPLVNLPGIDKPWGKEIRGCLISPKEDYVLCGADMTSLEDTTKRHYMKPYDPAYVKEMSQEGFDPHLDLAKHAGAVTQNQIDQHQAGKIDLKSLRKNYKVVNYSATYGVGAAKLSRETGMTVPEAKKLLDAYWQRNWSVAQFSSDNLKKVKTVAGQMWIQNPVSKFWHTLRYEKDVFSTLNQSTGAYCFDKWLAYYLSARPNIIGQFHDESINIVKKGDEDKHKATLIAAMDKLNKELKLNVELGIDVQFGNKYSEIH